MIPHQDDPEPLPFTAGFAILLALGAAYLQLVFFIAPVLFEWSSPAALQSPARLGIAAILAYGCTFALATRRIHEAPAAALGLVPAPWPAWLAAVLLLPSVMLVSEVDNLVKALVPMPQAPEAAATPPLQGMYLVEWSLVLIAVFPVVEEIFFRGLLQPPIVEAWGRLRGVLVCAALAGLAWTVGLGTPAMFAIVFTRGLVMGLLRESAASLQPGLLLHVGFGVVAVLAMRQAFGIPGFDDTSQAHTPLAWLVPAAGSTGVGLGLCRALLRARERAA